MTKTTTSEYRALFDDRGGRYNSANRVYPLARAGEADALLAHWSGTPAGRWLDVGAGGGFLADRATARGMTAPAVGCDESPGFLWEASGYASRAVVRYEALPFRDGAFAAAGCLAVLHHAEVPGGVLSEMLRVTKSGGRVAVGDVAAGSRAARFLNGFVDANTDAGHAGRFYDPKTLAGFLAAAGGRDVRSEQVLLSWRFADRAAALAFLGELFGLRSETRPGDLEAALDELGPAEAAEGCEVPWAMVFASAAAR